MGGKAISVLFRRYGIFLIIPSLVLGFSFLLKLAAGPYWLATNFDPSYQYLVNGLYLLKGLVPNHTDHPGTPVQMLCGAICWLFNMGRSTEDILGRVFVAPEFYMTFVFLFLSLFTFLTSIALAVYVFRKTDSKIAALLTQLPALSFLVLKSWETLEPVLPVVANISPEPLLIGVVNLFNLCLFIMFFSKASRDETLGTFFWGAVAGLGVAVKITFIPILLIPALVLSWKNKFIFFVTFAASFFLWTLPIISKYSIIWGWIRGIAMHQGEHVSAGSGLTQISSYLLNWEGIFETQWPFAICLLAVFLVLLWKLVTKKWTKATFFLLAVSLGVVFQFAAVAQHPGAHYLLPGLGLFSAVLALLYLQGENSNRLGQKIYIIFIIVLTSLGVWQAYEYSIKLDNLTRDILSFKTHVSERYPNSIFIDYYRSSSLQGALFFGDGWNLSPHLGKELSKVYPDNYYLSVWGNRIDGFNGKVWANDLLAQGTSVLFRGDGKYNFFQSPYGVQLLEKGRFESIYILTVTTEKQAAMLLAGSIHFFQAQDYAKAMMYALEARKLHYQPDSSVQAVINLITPYLH